MLIYYIGLSKDEDNFIKTFKDDLADCNLRLGWANDLIKDFESILAPHTIKDLKAFVESTEYLTRNSTKLIEQVRTEEIKE